MAVIEAACWTRKNACVLSNVLCVLTQFLGLERQQHRLLGHGTDHNLFGSVDLDASTISEEPNADAKMVVVLYGQWLRAVFGRGHLQYNMMTSIIINNSSF